MRVVALLLAVGLIVVGGFWLARDRAGNQATPTSVSAEGEAGAAGANAGAETASDSVGEAAGQDSAAAAEDATTADAAPADQSDQDGSDAGDGEADAAPTDTSGPAEDAPSGATDAETTDAAPADPAASLPEGFEPVAYLSETPQRVFDQAEQVLEDGTDYVAVLSTNRGDIVVDLYEERTPQTVNNFVFLALNRYYQGVPFHRVLEDFMAQTGDPTGTGSGGPGYQFEDEIVEGLVFDEAGLLAMANAGPGTNGSQFFITFAPTPWLNGAHTIFGHVIQGEELLSQIARVDPANPSAVVTPDETLAALAERGIELPGEPDQTVESAIAELVGTTPVAGQSFTVAGYRGVLGQLGQSPAYGFFNQPDTLLNVVIGQRPSS